MAAMELVMEKIRSKTSQYKSFAECAKALRMSQLEKRFPMDLADKNQLQKCLDTLQQSMKVSTLQGMVERLESISRQLSLKLMAGQTGLELFISSDMFYLEVSLESSGNVKDVKIHHEGKPEQQSCEELVKSLSNGDFDDFTTQLQGLISIYQLNAEKKVKCKAFSALCALETDMDAIWSLQSNVKDVQTLLAKSPVGILEKRKGGHPMKLTYFVSPYEVLETKKELTVELINKVKIGCNVTISLEGSAAHKLQTAPLVTINKASGKSVPVYVPMTSANSTTLPAYFVLKLNKPQPICVELVKHINAITELECCDISNPHPLFSLITQHVSNGKMDSSPNRGLFVNLPDQVHCYFMTECKGLDGVIVSSIPFTHPSQVPKILNWIRQQAVFNFLVSSVVRPFSKQDIENMIMLEITALSCQHISVSFEHPLQESMSTIEIDLSDAGSVSAKLYSTSTDANSKTSSEHVSKILQRCLSIPVTMRYLIKTLQSQQSESNLNTINNGSFSSAPSGGLGGGHDRSPMDASKIKQEPGISNGLNGKNGMLGSQFEDFPGFSSAVLDGGSLQRSASDQQKRKRKHEKLKIQKQKSTDDGDILLSSSSNDSTSLGTPADPNAEPDPGPAREKDEITEANELDDVEEMLKAAAGPARSEPKMKRPKEPKKSPSRSSLIMDLTDGKGLVPPGVTITPITCTTTNINSVLERRPGIEIIPLPGAPPPPSLAGTITITPISGSAGGGDKDERKSFKNPGFDDKMREKKRKRKREEEGSSKMGPPEKVPAKSDPLSKPVSVSIKPATDSPPGSNRPNSPSVRKITASPTQFREKTVSSIQPSPKHSPAAYCSSPKHSPKHGTSSPKQPSGSSGKPSMSALKSASGSPNSSKSCDAKNKSSGSSVPKEQRDKDSSSRKNSGTGSGSSSTSPKIKSSSVKLKQLDEVTVTNLGNAFSANSNVPGDPKNSGNPSQRNRKGSLSAVIDKLKSNAQEASDVVGGVAVGPPPGNPSAAGASGSAKREGPNGSSFKEGKISSGLASSCAKITAEKPVPLQKIPDGIKDPEYMVKPSSGDGMKLTINKTRSKESSKTGKMGGSSGTGSPKTHTGLKPGVVSGPASKKPASAKFGPVTGTSLKASGSLVKSSGSLKGLGSTGKSLSSKSTGSPTSGSVPTDLSSRKEMVKSRLSKAGSDKILFKEKIKKSLPASLREEESDKVVKTVNAGLPASLVVEGLIKPLPFDTKYQIPKLSARNNANNIINNNPDQSSLTPGIGEASEAPAIIGAGSNIGISTNSLTGSIGTGSSSSNNNNNSGSLSGGTGNSGNATNTGNDNGNSFVLAAAAAAAAAAATATATAAISNVVGSSSCSNNENSSNNTCTINAITGGNSIACDTGSNIAGTVGNNNNGTVSNSANNNGNNCIISTTNSSSNVNISSGSNNNNNNSNNNNNNNNNNNMSNNTISNNITSSTISNNSSGSNDGAIIISSISSSSTCSSNNNNNNNNLKSSLEKIVEKGEVKISEIATSKSSLDIAANLKYQSSKNESDRMAKIPNSGIPNLLSLPIALTNVSPKLPLTSPNLPTTSLSSITSKLDKMDSADASESTPSDKTDTDIKSSVAEVTALKFQSASITKPEDSKKSVDQIKHLAALPSLPSSEILLEFSSESALPTKIIEKAEKPLLPVAVTCFTQPGSPAILNKSPTRSPLNVTSQSPQSITDDELMDEALLLRK